MKEYIKPEKKDLIEILNNAIKTIAGTEGVGIATTTNGFYLRELLKEIIIQLKEK